MTAAMIPLVKVRMPPAEILMPELQAILYGGIINEGEQVYAFEKAFADHFGLPEVLGFSSGTGALHVALLCCGVEPSDEVITTAMTAEPTNTAILQAGGIPVFADVDAATGNLLPEDVERCIGPKTRVILVVHYAGYPAELEELRAIADRHGIALIEDCAHALGARFGDKPVGTFGDAAIFSFQAIKQLTTIDGGALVVRDPGMREQARKLRWFGMVKGVPRTELDIETAGFKYNMTNVAGLIGLRQLDTIEDALDLHRETGRFYDQELAGIPGLAPARVPAESEPTYWLYTLLADDSAAVEARLGEIGVAASKLHRPNDRHSVFAPFRRPLPGLGAFYDRLVHIPCGWWVSATQRQAIVDQLKKG